jgi:hypothetical protein
MFVGKDYVGCYRFLYSWQDNFLLPSRIIHPMHSGDAMWKIWLLALMTGANPTILIYNASVVIFYKATGGLVRFVNKNIFSLLKKCSRLLQRWRCSCKFKSRRTGSRDETSCAVSCTSTPFKCDVILSQSSQDNLMANYVTFTNKVCYKMHSFKMFESVSTNRPFSFSRLSITYYRNHHLPLMDNMTLNMKLNYPKF